MARAFLWLKSTESVKENRSGYNTIKYAHRIFCYSPFNLHTYQIKAHKSLHTAVHTFVLVCPSE